MKRIDTTSEPVKEITTTLVILAAGDGTRYGKGIKQLEKVGPSGETLMAYSIHDAVQAGFERVVIAINGELEDAFREALGERAHEEARICYAAQDIGRFTGGLRNGWKREKPWGTAHSLMCTRDLVNAPFAVINADDYYGKEAFRMLHAWLENTQSRTPDGRQSMALVSYILGNTLSEYGGVTRGICSFDSLGGLSGIRETRDIIRTAAGAQAVSGGIREMFSDKAQVSMNMWGMFPEVFGLLEESFAEFLERAERSETEEFLLPVVINGLLSEGRAEIAVLRSVEQWFGMTYRRDADNAARRLKRLTQAGLYKTPLF